MTEETKPTKPTTPTETKPAGTKPATGTGDKPAEGGDKPADSGSQIKDASLEFMSHQCGVLVIMKGGHMVDNAPWQKVEQLNVECETAGQGDPYGDCTSPGNYASMGSCEIGGGVKIAKVTQKYKISDTIPGTSWTFADYMGTTTKAYGKTNERFNAMMADEEKRTRFVQQAQYLKQVLALVGVGEKDITILSTIRDTGSAAHPYGLTVDFTVNDTKRNHEVVKKLYTMQRQGKLCANQIIWEMKAPNPKAVSKSSTEDNLNTSNAPGSQPVPTACNPSADSSDSSSSTDTGSSSDSSTSTDSGPTNTETKPTETKPTETKPAINCSKALQNPPPPVVYIGSYIAKELMRVKGSNANPQTHKKQLHQYLAANTIAAMKSLVNGGTFKDKIVVLDPMAIHAVTANMTTAQYQATMREMINTLTKTKKAARVVLMGGPRKAWPGNSKYQDMLTAVGTVVNSGISNKDRVMFAGNKTVKEYEAIKAKVGKEPNPVTEGLYAGYFTSGDWYTYGIKPDAYQWQKSECNFKVK